MRAAQVRLGWDPNSEADLSGYKVYYGTASRAYGVPIDVGNQTIYTVTGLEKGQVHYFAITAYDTEGLESGYSREVSWTVQVPENLVWDPLTEADIAGYKVYYGHASRVYGQPIDVGNQTSYPLAGLENGLTYYIAVTAYNTANIESDYSEELIWTRHLAESCLENENIAFNKPVEEGGPIYTDMPGSKAVDGIKNRSGNFWAGLGSPNWLIIDLQNMYTIDKVLARPYGRNSSTLRYYYDEEWNIQYSLDKLEWYDIYQCIPSNRKRYFIR